MPPSSTRLDSEASGLWVLHNPWFLSVITETAFIPIGYKPHLFRCFASPQRSGRKSVEILRWSLLRLLSRASAWIASFRRSVAEILFFVKQLIFKSLRTNSTEEFEIVKSVADPMITSSSSKWNNYFARVSRTILYCICPFQHTWFRPCFYTLKSWKEWGLHHYHTLLLLYIR